MGGNGSHSSGSGTGRDFPPVFSWDWDGKRLIFVGVGRERFENSLPCHPLEHSSGNRGFDSNPSTLPFDISLVLRRRRGMGTSTIMPCYEGERLKSKTHRGVNRIYQAQAEPSG